MSGFPVWSKRVSNTLQNWSPKLTALKKTLEDLIVPLEWGNFDTAVSASGSMTVTTNNAYCTFFRLYKTVFIQVYLDLTTGGTTSNEIYMTLPREASNIIPRGDFTASLSDTTLKAAFATFPVSSDFGTVRIRKRDTSNIGIGAVGIGISGFYRID